MRATGPPFADRSAASGAAVRCCRPGGDRRGRRLPGHAGTFTVQATRLEPAPSTTAVPGR
ncbi:hypothetical protein FTX61_09215 [Nitriliruptoraceae bacterium ZYF776]|nr:hypothetical protein [Profundirhabdus halotolerans]